ncbi:MAG TPA: universal stress protein [Dehalococcoidia bacterium]|nr:universal stress protein [Dehalococcoidia bacterium]
MKNVLVPLDGTKDAEAALPLLEQVCSSGDSIVLLSVQKPEDAQATGTVPGRRVRGGFAGPSGGVMGMVTPDVPVYDETKDQTLQRQIGETQDYLEGLAADLRRAGLDVKTEVRMDDHPAQAIVEYAKQMKPTFIAMLRRTHLGVGEILFGSVATQVIRSEVAPVLFVPGSS